MDFKNLIVGAVYPYYGYGYQRHKSGSLVISKEAVTLGRLVAAQSHYVPMPFGVDIRI